MKLIRYELFYESKYYSGALSYPFYPESILTKKEIREHYKLLKQLPEPKIDFSKVIFYFTEEGNLIFNKLIPNIKRCIPSFLHIVEKHIDFNEIDLLDKIVYEDKWQIAIVK